MQRQRLVYPLLTIPSSGDRVWPIAARTNSAPLLRYDPWSGTLAISTSKRRAVDL